MRCFILTVLLASFFLGCDQNESSHPNDDKKNSLRLVFSLMYEGKIVNCKKGELGFITEGRFVRIDRFAFYVHQPSLVIDKTETSLRLVDNQWQSQGTGLIYFNNKCQSDNTNSNVNVNVNSNQTLELDLSNQFIHDNLDNKQSEIVLNFNIGVPFAQNHLNPLIQASPMNVSSMFWSWRNGYKFMRLDLRTDTDGFAFHLGNLGCQSTSSVRAPQAPCQQSNVIKTAIELNQDLVETEQGIDINIAFDLSMLLKNVSIRREHSCMFMGLEQKENCASILQPLLGQQVLSQL